MKTRNFLIAAALAFATILSALPATAATQVLCAPEAAGTAMGPKRVTNPNTTTSYQLNGAGCGVIGSADVGYFLSQGFTAGPDSGTFFYTTGVATSTTDFVIGNLPANAYISTVIYNNGTANAVTGGITLGSTANGTDIATATTCAASCLAQATDAQLVKRAWSTTAATPIHAAAATSWNSANVTITVVYRYF
ncbi:hypothetical protein IVB43_23860 [Bradyrhizobium sp. 48]|uniref:hypothetical protein n=1 Tax=Bradyrhizobium sp. 48 TaxID=2782676 RepID=UPI001FFAA015|nr:hypothetical protein [Bradyrhizobium sp. 48]MCK1445425.1 hypothetical protein [Bradyrhizobium sp. 48]